MPVTTNDTKKKRKPGSGGSRKGAGRKGTGKKFRSYFLPVELIEEVSKQPNPSQFVEEAIKEKIENENF